MLTRFHKVLIAALAVQLILAVIVLTRGDDSAALKEHPLIAGFDAAKVTRLQVFAGDSNKADAGKPDAAKPIDLVKRDTSWVLASGFDYPVEQKKVDDVLSPIAKLAAAAPIATQAGRHKQLKVADTDFERKLVITAGGKDVTLFIGGPAGARRTAVRLGGDDRVYAVSGLTAFAVGSRAAPVDRHGLRQDPARRDRQARRSARRAHGRDVEGGAAATRRRRERRRQRERGGQRQRGRQR